MNNRDFWTGYMMGSSEGENKSSGGGDGSTIIAILSVICGLVLEAAFFTLFGIEVENVPAFFLVIGWAVGSVIANVVLECLNHKLQIQEGMMMSMV